MKKMIVIYSLLLTLAYHSEAQYGNTRLGFVPAQNDSTRLKIITTFLLGSSTTCLDMAYYTLTANSDTVYISPCYDLTGFGAAFGCKATDTIDLGILPPTVKVITVLPYTSTSIPPDTQTHAPVSIQKLLTVPQIPLVGNVLSVSPNPATDYLQIEGINEKVRAVYITDITGRVVNSYNYINDNKVPISELLPDAYYILRVHCESHSYSRLFLIQ